MNYSALVLLITLMSLFSCKVPVSPKKSDDSKVSPAKPEESNTEVLYSPIALFSYEISDEGLPAKKGEVQLTHLENSKSLHLNSELPEPKIDESFLEFASRSNILIARLNTNASLSNLSDQSVVEKGCYYSAYDQINQIFLLDPNVQIEPVISLFEIETEISFSGIICIDDSEKLTVIASNNALVQNTAGLDNLVHVLNQNSIALTPGDSGLSLTGGTKGFFSSLYDMLFSGESRKSFIFDSMTEKPHQKSFMFDSFFDEAPPKQFGKVNPEITAKRPNPLLQRFNPTKKRKIFDGFTPPKRNPLLFRFNSPKPVKVASKTDLAGDFLKMVRSSDIYTGASGTLRDGTKYAVGEKLGAGAFGSVYKIEITDSRGIIHEFAAKLFRRGEAPPANALLAQTTSSPYFLRKFGTAKDVELIELGGNSLIREFNGFKYSGPSNFVARGDLFHEIFDGISALHTRRKGKIRIFDDGAVHWDLKPENMLRGQDGRIKIIDLDDVSVPGSPKGGTPTYMSPEKYRYYEMGQNIKASTSDDIYSLGIMTFQAKYGGNQFKKYQGAPDLEEMYRVCCNIHIKIESTGHPQSYLNNLEFAHKQFKTYVRQLPAGPEREEMTLIARMIDPSPKFRPTITDVKSSWGKVHPKKSYPALDIFHMTGI